MSFLPTTLVTRINRLSAQAAVVVGGLLLFLAGVVDWFSGPELAFSVFYLPSVLLVAWTLGRWWGLGAAGASAAVWWFVELMTNVPYSHSFVPLWNGLVRWLIFSLVAVLTAEVAERKRVETALHRQTNILRSVLNSMGDGVVVVDREGRIALTNPAADQMLELAGGDGAVGWLSSPVTYLTDPLTPAPSAEHPLARAGRGKPWTRPRWCCGRRRSRPSADLPCRVVRWWTPRADATAGCSYSPTSPPGGVWNGRLPRSATASSGGWARTCMTGCARSW
ncbi:MAG: DUF4118 domain-containing protein [Verrucomicrobia bacterium]|nr:DUF4118 domain-containing protein [Verrucomicrobiota bacterium]